MVHFHNRFRGILPQIVPTNNSEIATLILAAFAYDALKMSRKFLNERRIICYSFLALTMTHCIVFFF
jgi:hypothetical protein